MNKRPKSREETPKEGSDSARRYRTATICDRAAQKARVFDTFPVQSSAGLPICNRSGDAILYHINQYLTEKPEADPPVWLVWYAKTRNLVMAPVIKKFTILQR
jgi:hypothetical protein